MAMGKLGGVWFRAVTVKVNLRRFGAAAVSLPKPTYSLDTSVVSYLLNGELWKRAPYNLLEYKPGLSYLCEVHGIERAPAYNAELKKSVAAYEWSCLHQNKVQLVASPTVGLELARAPQFQTSAWVPLLQVGVTPLYGILKDKTVEKVMWTLNSKIEMVLAGSKELLTDRLAHPGVALLSSPHHWKPHFSDLKIYLESCMALQLNDSASDSPEAFLVTDYHKFFHFFLQSKVILELSSGHTNSGQTNLLIFVELHNFGSSLGSDSSVQRILQQLQGVKSE